MIYFLVAFMEAEVSTVKEEMNKQLQESEAALELEKQKLLKVWKCFGYRPCLFERI